MGLLPRAGSRQAEDRVRRRRLRARPRRRLDQRRRRSQAGSERSRPDRFFGSTAIRLNNAIAVSGILTACVPDSVLSAMSESPRLPPDARSAGQTSTHSDGSVPRRSVSASRVDSRLAGVPEQARIEIRLTGRLRQRRAGSDLRDLPLLPVRTQRRRRAGHGDIGCSAGSHESRRVPHLRVMPRLLSRSVGE
jgi:hypothetical protein